MWLVLGSGIGLVALVLYDLQETVRVQDQRADDVARRDAERGARELRSLLTNSAVLERVPTECRFEIAASELVLPPELGWLNPPEPFDLSRELDAVLQDHLLRAEREEGAEANRLWTSLLADPVLSKDANDWLTARVAWFAQRNDDAQTRDLLLAQLEARAHELPNEVSAAMLLLYVEAGLPVPAWAWPTLPRLTDSRGDAVLARLEEQGVDVAEARRACATARARRALLLTVRGQEAFLANLVRPDVRADAGSVRLFYPENGRGARLSWAEFERLVRSLVKDGLAGIPPLTLGGTLVASTPSVSVVEEFAGIRAQPVEAAGFLSGTTGMALLSVLLATLCGGGAFFALRGARREADAARLRSEFVTGVTHELKTPLTGIRLTADLLADGHVRDEAGRRVHLERLGAEALRLSVLIDNVLDLGRFERGERGHNPVPTDLVELVSETLALFQPIAASAKIELVFDHPEESLPSLVDRDALRQALLNVLDNARKYGGQHIDVELKRTAGTLCVAVQDRGPGISRAERGLIFERFRRGARYQDGSVPGVGLGLYLARALLRQHGGDLVCVDPPGNSASGARFELRFPDNLKGARA